MSWDDIEPPPLGDNGFDCRCFPTTMHKEHYHADARLCVCSTWDLNTPLAADKTSHHRGCWLSEGKPVAGYTPAHAHALLFGDEVDE